MLGEIGPKWFEENFSKKIYNHDFLGFNFSFKSWIRLFFPLWRRTKSIFIEKRIYVEIILRLKMEKIYHVTKTPASSMRREIFFHSTIRWITLSLVIIFNLFFIYWLLNFSLFDNRKKLWDSSGANLKLVQPGYFSDNAIWVKVKWKWIFFRVKNPYFFAFADFYIFSTCKIDRAEKWQGIGKEFDGEVFTGTAYTGKVFVKLTSNPTEPVMIEMTVRKKSKSDGSIVWIYL